MNFLLDKDFLYSLNQYKHKEIFVKIISLSFDELPLEQIEGRVISGSININGDSAVRRACNLSLIAQNVNITDFYWGVSNKFTLEIGVKNMINRNYPDIIWFKQGIFIISSFNSILTNNNYQINISGKDKMCLLNGDMGGSLPSSIDFGKVDVYEDSFSEIKIENPITEYKANKFYIYDSSSKKYVLSDEEWKENIKYYIKDTLLNQESLTLKDIIREAVHTYGKEMYHNIIINNLDDTGLELIEYRGDTPLYLLYDEQAQLYSNLVINGDFIIDEDENIKISEVPQYNTAVNVISDNRSIYYLGKDKIPYSVTQINTHDTVGYRVTDLIYAGELISSIGDSLTSILDKIKNMLGGFEYFYNLDGKFVFQAKPNYTNKSWSSLINTDDNIHAKNASESSPYSYSFEDVNLIQRFQNTPKINNIKNDYSIWGIRKTLNGAEIPIHARYAIHKKPFYYKSIEGHIYTTLNAEDLTVQPNQNKLPDCLKEGFEGKWWDIFDWAEIYKTMTGNYPDGIMGTYGNRTCKMDLNAYFPAGVVWNKNRPLFLFEVEADGKLGNCGHNPSSDNMKPIQSCTAHKYSYFLDRAQNGIRSFIYDPTIPIEDDVIYHSVDWREIIYQMALDFFKYNQDPDFKYKVHHNNMEIKTGAYSYYPGGETGYEGFYTDMQAFWRTLYDPNPIIKYKTSGGEYREYKKYVNDTEYKIVTEWIDFVEDKNTIVDCDFYLKGFENNDFYSINNYYWNKSVFNAPETLNFWIDFYDQNDAIFQYSISKIGARSKVVNNTKISSVYFKNIPDVILTTSEEYSAKEIKTGYTYIWLPSEMQDLFTISSQGKSAEDEKNELFNKYSYCSEGISITTIPIYYLEPNTLIQVYNEENGINGKYQINKIAIPLTYNGMMQINATKIIDQIF